ncbi:ATP-binding cassette, subfamily B [Nonomuraea jiangxiensis]|uniref:ATP-binding cassette, subfamily B n=2 Tax=Nonomuraea jiangxiensis TaxID=633440 RepID=A0A1G7Z0U1_9ACTN|nr:ATP-binding cassette, subfamily B [Nonomuraea jiangxiensis]
MVADALFAVRLTWHSARGALLVPVALTLASAAVPVVIAWLTKTVLDRILLASDQGNVLVLACAIAVAGLVAAVLPHITEFFDGELDRRIGAVAFDRLYAAVERFIGLGRFENPEFLDRLRLADQSAHSIGRLLDAGLSVVRGALMTAGFIGVLFSVSPAITAVVLMAVVPTLAAELALSRRRARMTVEVSPAERREFFYSQLLSSVDAAKEIRLFGIGAFLRGRMLRERRAVDTVRRRTDGRELLVQSVLGALGTLIAGGGLVWAILAAWRGSLTVGDISLFVAAIAGVQAALGAMIGGIARGHHGLLLFDHYCAVVNAPTDLPVPASPTPIGPLREGIELRDVWFRYSADHPWALRGVNLRIPYGQAVALVGRNGAGKSTLVKLLCRFYDPTRGAILWDGVDIRSVAPERLRERVAAVFQDYMEYDLTAGENIALGDISAIGDQARITAAAVRADVHETLAALPQGYETMLSRMFLDEMDKADPRSGVVLSGGQWQRLALARAFIREHRDLLILDEPSSGLDAEAESEIHRGLRAYGDGRTSLLISHRLGSVRDADLIVVLDEGVIVERGPHADLMSAAGQYAQMFSLQAIDYQPH